MRLLMLYLCQPGFETLLAVELTAAGAPPVESGPGWCLGPAVAEPAGLVFPHLVMRQPELLTGDSHNHLVDALHRWLLDAFRGRAIDGPWPCLLLAGEGHKGLGQRAKHVRQQLLADLRKRLGRVARLADDRLPPPRTDAFGCFVFFRDYETLFAANDAWIAGPRRMADDPAAPSRSYLKLEEAFLVGGCPPKAGETAVDLGAAPGGWSYSAAQRGVQVEAIDNGPLKGGAAGHPGIVHRRADAFLYQPPAPVDWLLCDLVEHPRQVLELLGRWCANGWCRQLVANLKFGQTEPLRLIGDIRAFARAHLAEHRLHHLFHDRDELTLIGRR